MTWPAEWHVRNQATAEALWRRHQCVAATQSRAAADGKLLAFEAIATVGLSAEDAEALAALFTTVRAVVGAPLDAPVGSPGGAR
jgi:hypothetical protein